MMKNWKASTIESININETAHGPGGHGPKPGGPGYGPKPGGPVCPGGPKPPSPFDPPKPPAPQPPSVEDLISGE